ncbi:hypothetical protein MKX01_029215 [Papaver californicum]|nr:hypothetical protein MKX01_029215 [Papaver californicum]
MEKGKEIFEQNQQRKLYTNSSREDWYRKEMWSHKKDIIEDLIAFSEAGDYYAKMGKAWRRGYLLYGPPGTGKSTMVASMAKLLNYDVYDLELKSVRGGNSEIRKLLLDTSDRSIIVIEDIDSDMHGVKEVTLSGLLNFIDGLWSTTGGERLIVFTTNHIEELDPALIRTGRMDRHSELSYCCFEGFKILAKNYLNLDSHHLFETIRCLIDETQITPADVAECLIPKTVSGGENTETCLKNLIQALQKLKEDAN